MLDLHPQNYGFDLTFYFSKNSYFKQTCLKQSFYMKNKDEVDFCVGSTIEWTSGSDVTKIKKTKGKGKKKTTVIVKANSFFNFFESINPRVES